MNGTGRAVTHLVGRDRPGDPVAATARALARTLDRSGRPGRLVTAADLAVRSDRADGPLVVHSSDGGEALAPALAELVDRPLTLVHHGSAAGADRGVLRALRTPSTWAVGVDPTAREELRGLGYARVAPLQPLLLDDAFDVESDAEAASHVRAHPGPSILHVGPLGPNRSVEVLLDAFTELVTRRTFAATLCLCGPSTPWYLGWLRRRIAAHGLQSCELFEPTTEGQVLARLERADVVVALPPAALDPYVVRAARDGTPVVAAPSAALAGLGPEALVEVEPGAGTAALARALEAAIERGSRPAPATPRPDAGALARRLGLP
jgi:glycosyltransferase involved in cell wall biosynthesis